MDKRVLVIIPAYNDVIFNDFNKVFIAIVF